MSEEIVLSVRVARAAIRAARQVYADTSVGLVRVHKQRLLRSLAEMPKGRKIKVTVYDLGSYRMVIVW